MTAEKKTDTDTCSQQGNKQQTTPTWGRVRPPDHTHNGDTRKLSTYSLTVCIRRSTPSQGNGGGPSQEADQSKQRG